MDLRGVLILIIISFFVIAGAVRLAISPLIISSSKFKSVQNDKLYKLRDIGVLTEQNIVDYKDIEKGMKDREEIRIEYLEGMKVLKELHDFDVITVDEYEIKSTKLRDAYKLS